jgi:putative RecB family exonuclease
VPKPTLSPSKITTYLACPLKYRWTYVDDRGKWYLRAKSHYSFGTTLHRVLERFYASEGRGVETREQLAAIYDESWIEAGFSSADEMAEAYGEGKEMLERHVAEAQFRPTTAHTLYTEKKLKLEFDEFLLIGRVDRIDEHDDGTLEIIDYKSGRASVTEEDVATDIAMAVYQLLLRATHPDRNVIATIVALRTGEKASAHLSDEELASFRRDVHTLGCEIVTNEYHDFVPRLMALCRSCDFLPLCRRHEEFADALAAVDDVGARA